jgi:hypothetical protein
MNKWLILTCLSAAFMINFTGCSKGSSASNDNNDNDPHVFNPADTIAPIIEINSPMLNQVFSSGNIINVTGKVTDGDGLYQGSISIVNDANNAVLKEQLYVIHGLLQYDFNISHTASVTTISDYTITIEFEDHGLNKTSNSVKVKVNP